MPEDQTVVRCGTRKQEGPRKKSNSIFRRSFATSLSFVRPAARRSTALYLAPLHSSHRATNRVGSSCPRSFGGVFLLTPYSAKSAARGRACRSISSKRPRPQLPARRNRRQNSQIRLFSRPQNQKNQGSQSTMSLGPAPASPSTLNTPLHTLNCTAFTIASAADNIALKGPGPRAV